MKFALVTDMSGIEFGEPGTTVRLHAMPTNKSFKHPRYGTINFDDERIMRFADSVNSRIRGIEPDIDYGHKEFTDKAAGWVKAAEAGPDGLHLNVEFTEAAKEAIRQGEYRYFSPEFADRWENPETGAVHKDVVFGGGITNRPFLKDLVPYSLGENFVGMALTEDDPVKGGKLSKFIETLRSALKLSDESTEDEIQQAFASLAENSEPNPPEPTPDPAPVQLDEATQARFAALEATVTAQAERLRAGETDAFVARLAEGTGGLLPIPVQDKARAFFEQANDEQRTTLTEMFTELLENGIVPTGTSGDQNSGQQSLGEDPVAALELKIKELMDADKSLSYRDAASQASKVLGEDTYKDYRNVSFIEGRVR